MQRSLSIRYVGRQIGVYVVCCVLPPKYNPPFASGARPFEAHWSVGGVCIPGRCFRGALERGAEKGIWVTPLKGFSESLSAPLEHAHAVTRLLRPGEEKWV